MIIGVDLDGTYGADPQTFSKVVAVFQAAGHTCLLITNREGSIQDAATVHDLFAGIDKPMEVLFCNGRPKREVAWEAGYDVNVWIDDNPILVDYGVVGLSMVGFCR